MPRVNGFGWVVTEGNDRIDRSEKGGEISPGFKGGAISPGFNGGEILSNRADQPAAPERPSPVTPDGQISFSNIFEDKNATQGGSRRSELPLAGRPDEKLGPMLDNNRLTRLSQGNSQISKADTFALVGDLKRLDPNKPTIAFLDDSSDKVLNLDGQVLSHPHASMLGAPGRFNAFLLDQSGLTRAAETLDAARRNDPAHGMQRVLSELQHAGLNNLGLDKLKKNDLSGAERIIDEARSNFSRPLNEVADKIRAGELPLGRGDVLNVSMGNNAERNRAGEPIPGTGDPTFSELSEKLGFDVNAENLSANKDRILSRLGEIAADPSDPAWQKRAQQAVDTNRAIERIQALGVEVAHSASNDGNDRVDIDFLRADHEIKSVDPKSGAMDKFSGQGNAAADGVVPIYRSEDLTGPRYVMAGREFNRNQLRLLDGQVNFNPVLDSVKLDDGTISAFRAKLLPKELQAGFDTHVGRTAPAETTAQGVLKGVAVGNSFGNINFFNDDQLNRLRSKKQAASSNSRV